MSIQTQTIKQAKQYVMQMCDVERVRATMIAGKGVLTVDQIERVKAAASKDGWHSFRVTTLDLSVAPDFSKCLQSN